jgi:predicted component of type VI protein secretion system
MKILLSDTNSLPLSREDAIVNQRLEGVDQSVPDYGLPDVRHSKKTPFGAAPTVAPR